MSVKISQQSARIAVVTTEIEIDAPKETVYRAWFDQPESWFYENEESKLKAPTRCQEELGGRFYMELPNNGFNVIGEMTMIKPNHKIRMRGDCTMPSAVLMNMTVTFEENDGKTRVSVDHRMMGEFDDSAPAEFEAGWLDGLTKLKALLS